MYSEVSMLRRKMLQPAMKKRRSSNFGGFTGNLTRLSGPSNYDSSLNTSKNLSDVVIVIMEGRGKADDRIGIAMHDIRYPEVDLCEFVDSKEFTRLKTMINVHRAFDIVIQNGNEEKGLTKFLGESLVAAFPDASLQSISTKYFKPEKGEKQLKTMMNEEVSKVSDKFADRTLALGAFAVLLKYIHETRAVFFRLKSLRIREIVVDDTCMIDFASWESLEIVETDDISKQRKNQMKQRRTLLSVVDHTITQNGSRLLRSNILQPSTDLGIIDGRLDAVEELNQQPQLRERLRALLSRAHELDRVMAMCIQRTESWTVRAAEANVNQVVKLVQSLKVILAIREVLEDAGVKSDLLLAKTEFLKDDRFDRMMDILNQKIDDTQLDNRKNSLHLRNTKCYAIKEGVSINLDVARKAYRELLSRIDEVGTAELLEYFDSTSARLSYSHARGFHYTYVTRNAQGVMLPNVFSELVRNRSTITFSSRKMISINDRIDQVVAEMFLASDIVVADIIDKIRPVLPVLYYAMDAISTIDFLCSMAAYSSARDTCRPKFGSCFSISQGRHPILDWADTEATVTNDTCLTRDRRFGIITGPNMAGKSTYLKQVAQIAIIAQAGCFIPADFATVPVFSRIFSRMGHNDELMRNKSAFASEMNDAASILQYADSRSLVVLDELARSTSTEEGVAITYAICEKVLALQCYTFLATHFLDIAVLSNHSTAVENYHFQPYSDTTSTNQHHKLRVGPYRGPLYGFELVELSTFPDEVINHASALAAKLRSQVEIQKRDFELERHRMKVYMYHRIKETAEVYMEKYGENWKFEAESIKKLGDLRNYLNSELARIDREQQASEDE